MHPHNSKARYNKFLIVISLVLLVLLLGEQLRPQVNAPTAFAANGDLVHTTNFSVPCDQSLGVGIAFDGEFLWYSCYGATTDLYRANAITGQVVASYQVAGGLGALAWDGTRKKIWAGWGGGVGSDGDIRLFDPQTGNATLVFNASQQAMNSIDDGLAYDAQDDTLYVSFDGATTISHYSTAGALLGEFSWGGNDCYNSGLGIGGQLLFQGSNGCNHVWVVDKSTHAASFDFGTGAGGVRDEDLECDAVTFRPRTVMWSVEAYEPRRAIAFEIPPGSCGTGGGVDTDRDGLLDEWETDGVTIDPDGDGGVDPQFIDLPAMGADKDKADIFLHIDWMDNGAHSHKLSSAAIQNVVTAFANSPYVNTNGATGINMHVDQGPDSTLNFSTNTTWGTLSRAHAIAEVSNLGTVSGGAYNWGPFQAIKDTNTTPGVDGFTETGRTPVFHYVISAHNYGGSTSSGISRGIGASDLIVSLGSWPGFGTVNEQAGTLMHELGHNLSLRHGGSDNINYKPNYLSIMSYAFQLQGLIQGGVGGNLDYSRQTLGNLNEANLNEPAGLGGAAAGYGTRHFCPGMGYVPVTNASGAIDWNCNNAATEVGVSYDINNGGGSAEVLTGFNDWANLQLKGGAIGLAGVEPDLPSMTEPDPMTLEEAEQVVPVSQATATPTLTSTSMSTLTPTLTSTLTSTLTPTSTSTSMSTLTPTSTSTAIDCTLQFTDVPTSGPFYPFVRCLACRSILGGYTDGTFRPNNEVTRGQLSKIVSNAAGFNEAVSGRMFEDIPSDQPFYEWVQRLAARGHIGGYPCGSVGEPCNASGQGDLPYFRPNANATRGQISKIVSNAANFDDTPISQTFEDVPPASPFYPWIQRLTSRGIMSGYPCGDEGEPCNASGQGDLPYFRPNNNATRGQTAKIVSNTFFPNCQTPAKR